MKSESTCGLTSVSMTRPVGEVFTFYDSKLVVLEDAEDVCRSPISACKQCALYGMACINHVEITGFCEGWKRSDKKDVHFKKFGVDF